MENIDYQGFFASEIPRTGIEAAGVVVLPVCYEHAVSYGGGTRQGPLHIMAASEHLERLDEETCSDWTACGIHTLKPLCPGGSPEEAMDEIAAAAGDVVSRDKFLLAFGGDHAVTIGTVKAVSEKYPDVGILQVDAHLDLRDTWNGSRFNHGCVMRRIMEDMGLAAVQVGIRLLAPEERDYIEANGLSPIFAHQIDPGNGSWIYRVVEGLPEKVYITVDVDGLDPSVVPGTGTPVPGGLSFRQLVDLVRAVGKHKQVVGADIVELVKIPGTQASEMTAARIAQKIIHFCA